MCVGDWEWMEYNPARRVKREREAPGRVRFLSDAERESLLQACKNSRSANLFPIVVLALSTGMRRGELMNLTWSQIDLSKGIIQLNETKNGERRRVALRSFAQELLREHGKVRRLDTNFVFPGIFSAKTGKPFELRIYWDEVVEKVELKDFKFHDLRHSCASYLAMNGASLLEIAEVLGHKTMQMVKRYSHLAESHTASVVERMNDQIFTGIR
jgi:integrase